MMKPVLPLLQILKGRQMRLNKVFLLSCLGIMLSACAIDNHPSGTEMRAQMNETETAAYHQKIINWKEKHKMVGGEQLVLGRNVEVIPAVKGYKARFKKPKYPDKATEDEMMYVQYGDAYSRLVENVSVQNMDENQVTYRYHNARIDELAMLAGMYCKKQNDKSAMLQKITLHKNQVRLATFDCIRL